MHPCPPPSFPLYHRPWGLLLCSAASSSKGSPHLEAQFFSFRQQRWCHSPGARGPGYAFADQTLGPPGAELLLSQGCADVPQWVCLHAVLGLLEAALLPGDACGTASEVQALIARLELPPRLQIRPLQDAPFVRWAVEYLEVCTDLCDAGRSVGGSALSPPMLSTGRPPRGFGGWKSAGRRRRWALD